MELHQLSKTELLEKCNELGIKKYKSKNKSELINFINQFNSNKLDLHRLSKTELLEKCNQLGIKKYKSKNKSELINLINQFNTNNTQDENMLNENVINETTNDETTNDENVINEITNNENNINKINVLDLFCGCGGMSKGLTDAGLNIIAGIDIWDKAINSYKNNFDHQAICKDLTELSPEKFNELYNKKNNNIDLIVGGPPCQGFSIAGKRDTKDPRNSLFMEYVKYINYFRPKAFIMENVIGILSMRTDENEKVIDIILSELNVNYNCIVTKLYASDFEVPQNRRRTIIIGINKNLNIIPTEPEPILSIENRIPVKNILLPKHEVDSSYYLSEKALLGIRNKKKKSKENGTGFGAQFLDLNKPSFTIPARYWKDGYDALVKYSDTEIRRLTIKELKRIQSFSDDYILEGSKKDIIMQIGNAVACKFAYHLGVYITNILQ
jgi:DNA (cytosine-5)-methyltransferase 1